MDFVLWKLRTKLFGPKWSTICHRRHYLKSWQIMVWRCVLWMGHKKCVELKSVHIKKSVADLPTVVWRHMMSWKYKMTLRKNLIHTSIVKFVVYFERIIKIILFLAYLFSTESNLIRHKSSYKVHSHFSVNHFVH